MGSGGKTGDEKETKTQQKSSAAEEVFLLRTSDDTGHGGGTPLKAQIEQAVDVFAFMYDQLGMIYQVVCYF